MSLQLRVQIVKRLNTNYKEPDPLDKKIFTELNTK